MLADVLPVAPAHQAPVQDVADRAAGFDANRAMHYLHSLAGLGPRVSGSRGMQRQQALIRRHFDQLGLPVRAQTFTVQQVSQRQPVRMTNLIVSINPQLQRRVLLAAHYDTRPLADQEPDPSRWRQPFLGANDGASGAAFLMEMARHLRGQRLAVGVDLVFFDGEEYIFEPGRDRYFLGSEHFAQAWQQSRGRPAYVGAVLLDMIAGQGATFPFEANSLRQARGQTRALWQAAARQGARAFVPRLGPGLEDDHLALLRVGIPATDIIDPRYPHWHRLSDVPANCAPGPMAQVARVLAAWLPGVS